MNQPPNPETVGGIIDQVRYRIFVQSDYSALNNFNANLPGGYRRSLRDQIVASQGSDPAEHEDLQAAFYRDMDEAIQEAGLDPDVIEALNIATAATALDEDLADHIKIRVALARYIFPAYEMLISRGTYTDFDLRS